MKKIATFLFGCLLSASMFAQVPDGTIIPDFTSTTLDGDSWTLYDHLNEGRPVLIDVSATWCGPCWNYHNGHAFKDTWDAHGPDGDNTIGMIMVEGDADTNVDCLYGPTNCNDATAGDWVTGTPYPITDDTYVAQTIFDISAYPSIFLVCPDRTVLKLGQDNATELYSAATACEGASGDNNASILKLDLGSDVRELCGSDVVELTPEATIISMGTMPMTSATLTLSLDGTVLQTMDWTGNLPTFNSEVISLDPLSISDAGVLEFSITNVNGGMDDDMSNNVSIAEFRKPEAEDQILTVDILTDQYGVELYWEARKLDNTVIASGGNVAIGPDGGGVYDYSSAALTPPADPSAYGANESVQETVVVPEMGCYYFHIVDGYGDGICCGYGDGHFRVYNSSDVSLMNPIVSTGDFGAVGVSPFGTSDMFTNVENLIPATSLSVFPNPTASSLNVRFDLNEATEVGLVITNTLGQVVRNIAPNNMVTGQQTILMPVQDLTNGVYNVVLQTPEGSIARKFTVLK